MQKTLVLFSGGLDSTVVLAEAIARGEVLALSIDYGQSNGQELACARELATLWKFPHKVIQVAMERKDPQAEIPARNTVFLAKALEQAILEGCDEVAYGAEPDAVYTDSSVRYIEAMAAVFRLHNVKLTAPVKLLKDKQAVLEKALDYGVPLDLVHSSLTQAVDGKCKTSKRWLTAVKLMFPNVEPLDLLRWLREGHGTHTPFYLRTAQTGSFKYFPALFHLAACCPEDPDAVPTVWTTGNWGKSLRYWNNVLAIYRDIDVCITDSVEQLSKNTINTNSRYAQWGIKQALSRLPRPRYLDQSLLFRVTQGHLRRTILELGYKEFSNRGMWLET